MRKQSAGGGWPRRGASGRRKRVNIPLTVTLLCIFALLAWGIIGLSSMAAAERDAVDACSGHIADLDIVKAESAAEWPVTRYEGFSLAFDERRHTPVWVAWELLGVETSGDERRKNRFWQDEDVYGCPSPSDYRNSGFDRGHMCPAAEQKWSSQAMRDCFSMANMCPQDHALNTGAWNTLENKERLWAVRDSAIVIVAGPIYSGEEPRRIGESGVAVPDAFYKVLLAPYLDKPRAIGFVYPNMRAPGNMQDYAMSVDDVEKITGLDFFATLPDEIEKEVESKFSFQDWNRR